MNIAWQEELSKKAQLCPSYADISGAASPGAEDISPLKYHVEIAAGMFRSFCVCLCSYFQK